MNEQQKKRFAEILKNTLAVIGVGLAYYIFTRVTSIAIPCVFYKLTGILCPGCGVTRMCMALISFDFEQALRSNMLLCVSAPFLLFFMARRAYKYVKLGESGADRSESVFYVILAILALVFTVMRNMEQFAFLAPV